MTFALLNRHKYPLLYRLVQEMNREYFIIILFVNNIGYCLVKIHWPQPMRDYIKKIRCVAFGVTFDPESD